MAHARTIAATRPLIFRRAWFWTGFLAFAARPAQAAETEAWVQRYNGPANGDDRPSAVAVDDSGNVVVTGYSWNGTNDDYYTAKYAAVDGVFLREKRYNGPAMPLF